MDSIEKFGKIAYPKISTNLVLRSSNWSRTFWDRAHNLHCNIVLDGGHTSHLVKVSPLSYTDSPLGGTVHIDLRDAEIKLIIISKEKWIPRRSLKSLITLGWDGSQLTVSNCNFIKKLLHHLMFDLFFVTASKGLYSYDRKLYTGINYLKHSARSHLGVGGGDMHVSLWYYKSQQNSHNMLRNPTMSVEGFPLLSIKRNVTPIHQRSDCYII